MRVSTRLKLISILTLAASIVLAPLLIWSLIEFRDAKNDYILADAIRVNFFERAAYRNQYFLYREDRIRKFWDVNKEASDRLLQQALIRFEAQEDKQTLQRLSKYIEETKIIFHRIVSNTAELKSAHNNRYIYEELDKRLFSQLLVKAVAIRDLIITLEKSSSARIEKAYQRLALFVGIFALTLALTTILTSIQLGRFIRRRLQPLHAGAKSVASGDLDYRIRIQGVDEFSELASSTNLMTEKLQEFTRKLEAEISAHKLAEDRLSELNRDFVSFLENTSDFIYFKDAQSRFRFCSQTLANITGHASWRDLLGKHDLEVFPKDTAQIYTEEEVPIFRDGEALLNKIDPYYDRNGNLGWVSTNKWPLLDHEGRVIGLFGISRDITESKKAEAALRESESLFRMMADTAPVLIWMADVNKLCTWFNKGWLDFTGRSMEQEVGNGWAEGVHPDDFQHCLSTYVKAFEARQEFVMEYRLRRCDGAYRWLIDHGVPRIDGQGAFLGYIGTCMDISDRHLMEEQIRQMAFYDPLTKLPNRRLFNERMIQNLVASKRSGRYGALLFLDMDNFKPLNDLHGHDLGDMLLAEVASRISGCVREADTVARMGGDEFVVILNELETDKTQSALQASAVAEKIRNALAKPYLLPLGYDQTPDTTITHHCTTSIGVVMFIGREESPEELVKCADTAVYQAKSNGRDQICFYNPNH